MTPFPSLPTEILPLIWDHLRVDGLDLANCSLVCQDWLIPTQRALFSGVQLKLPPGDCVRRYDLLLLSPRLQTMIVSLTATLNLETDIECIEPLASIFGLLPNVHTLELKGDGGQTNDFPFTWSEHEHFSPRFRENLQDLISQPCFTTLILGNFTILFEMDNWAFQRFLSHSRSMKSLQFLGGGILKAGDLPLPLPPPESPIEPIKLEALSLVVGCFTWFTNRLDGTEWPTFLHPFDFSALKELCIDHEQSYFCSLPRIIPTLEKLIVISRLSDTRSTDVVDLSHASPKLQNITFKVHTNRQPHRLLNWVEDSLRSLPPTNSVQYLSFTIFALSPKALFADYFLFPQEFFQDWDENVFVSRWEDIGHTIAPSNLPFLHQVKISTFGSHNGAELEGLNIAWLDISSQAEAGLLRARGNETRFRIATIGEEIPYFSKAYLYL